jgi:hypothetical protein
MLEHLVRRTREGRGVRMRARRHIPFGPLTLYYGIVIAIGFALVRWVPGADDAIMAPIVPALGTDLIGNVPAALPATEAPWAGPFGRLALATFTIAGAVVLALPIAGVYMHTRRLRYDPSLVQTMIVLPIVVAGVVLVVKNSLALAFALAGIVAGVRFRQKLNEPKDAVYVLLSLGLGLAAAVQALDIALAVSLSFNIIVLALWRFDPRSYAASTLSIGDIALLEQEPRLQVANVMQIAQQMDTDGILVVHAPDAEAGRVALELSLATAADEWRMSPPEPTRAGMHRFDVVVRLARGTDPLDLVDELEERWTGQIAAAEYTPFRRRHDKPDDDDDDDD